MHRSLAGTFAISFIFATSGCVAPAIAYDRGFSENRETIASTQASISIANASGATFRMRDGRATIVGTEGDLIKATLELKPHPDRDFRGKCDKSVARGATVSMRRLEKTIEIEAGGIDRIRCAEHWRIEVPRSSSLTASGDVARIDVSEMRADTYVTVDVGNISISSRKGSASGLVKSVGNVNVLSGSADYEDAIVKADVGRTELSIDGHRVDAPRAPGPGGRIALRGSGTDKLRAETGVGNAKLEVNR